MTTMLVKVVSRSGRMFGVTWIVCNSYRLGKCLLVPLIKKFCRSKSEHKTMFGREINYVFEIWWCLRLMRGRTSFWKCIKRLGILENNEHWWRFINNITSTIGSNKSRPLSRLVNNVCWLGEREVSSWMWRI
jgi:hypothetical protein